mgnify:CR=1 FL=1
MGRTTERKESTLREKNEIPPANQTEKDLEQRIEKVRRNSKTGVVFMVAGGAVLKLSMLKDFKLLIRIENETDMRPSIFCWRETS